MGDKLRQAFRVGWHPPVDNGAFLPAAAISPLDFRPVIWYPLL
ncbi:hypothetical protein [Ensifer sp. BR816]|nr:hypothetical protein [Ensifer sp. BR816]